MNDDVKQPPVPAIPAQPGIDTIAIPLVSSEELLARAAQPVQQPAPVAADLAAFNAYFCATLSCDGVETEQQIEDCRVAAYDAWCEATRRAAAHAALAAPVAAPVAIPAASVQPITCQIYGHVVGHCGECNVGDEGAAQDMHETNHILAGHYLRMTCGTADSVQPTSIDGQSQFSRSVLHTIYRACQRGDSPERLHAAVMAEFDKQPDSGRDAALADDLDLIRSCIEGYPASPARNTALATIRKVIAAHPAPPKDEGRDAAARPVKPSGDELRKIVRSAHADGSDGTLPQEYVMAGWNAAIAAHPANVAQVGELSDAQIVAAWQSMPGGPDGWLKSFGFLQFARAVLAAAKKRGTGITASVLEQATQACDQQADGTNGPYRSACPQCANAVHALRDATVDAGDQAAAATNQETPP